MLGDQHDALTRRSEPWITICTWGHLIASENKTVARVKVTAKHQGEFMGVPPTDARVEIQLIDIMRFDDGGLVCEHWGVTDMLSLMQQLGVVPAGPAA